MTVDHKHHCHVPLENADGVAIDDKLAILTTDFTLETAVSGIVFKHVDLKRRENDSFRIPRHLQCNYKNFFSLEILFSEQIR